MNRRYCLSFSKNVFWKINDMKILGLQPRDKAAMLGLRQYNFFSKILHENRVYIPREKCFSSGLHLIPSAKLTLIH